MTDVQNNSPYSHLNLFGKNKSRNRKRKRDYRDLKAKSDLTNGTQWLYT